MPRRHRLGIEATTLRSEIIVILGFIVVEWYLSSSVVEEVGLLPCRDSEGIARPRDGKPKSELSTKRDIPGVVTVTALMFLHSGRC